MSDWNFNGSDEEDTKEKKSLLNNEQSWTATKGVSTKSTPDSQSKVTLVPTTNGRIENKEPLTKSASNGQQPKPATQPASLPPKQNKEPLLLKPTPVVTIKKPVPKDSPIESKPTEHNATKHPSEGGKAPRTISKAPVIEHPQPPFIPTRDEEDEEEEDDDEDEESGEGAEEQEDENEEEPSKEEEEDENGNGEDAQDKWRTAPERIKEIEAQRKTQKKEVEAKVSASLPKKQEDAPKISAKKNKDISPSSNKKTKMSKDDSSDGVGSSSAKKPPVILVSDEYDVNFVPISWKNLPPGESATLPVHSCDPLKRSSTSMNEMPNNLNETPKEMLDLPDKLPIAVHRKTKEIRVFPQFMVAIASNNVRKPQNYWDTLKKNQKITVLNVRIFGHGRTTVSSKDMITILDQSFIAAQSKTQCLVDWIKKLSEAKFTALSEMEKTEEGKKKVKNYQEVLEKMSGPNKPKAASKPRSKKTVTQDSVKSDDEDPEEQEYKREKAREAKREREQKLSKPVKNDRHRSKDSKSPFKEKASSLDKKRSFDKISKNKERRGETESDDDEDEESEDSFVVDDEEDDASNRHSTKHKHSHETSSSFFDEDSDSSSESADENVQEFSQKALYISKYWALIGRKEKQTLQKLVNGTTLNIRSILKSKDRKKKRHAESFANDQSSRKKRKH